MRKTNKIKTKIQKKGENQKKGIKKNSEKKWRQNNFCCCPNLLFGQKLDF